MNREESLRFLNHNEIFIVNIYFFFSSLLLFSDLFLSGRL